MSTADRPSPHASTPRHTRLNMLRWAFVLMLGFFILTVFDRDLWRLLKTDTPVATLRTKEWYQAFRQMGGLVIWAVAALAVARADLWAARRLAPSRALVLMGGAWKRGAFMFLAAALSGVVAELLKFVVRRERPGETGEYVLAWFAEEVRRSPGLGLASSHAAVAWGGAFAAARLWPGAGPALYAAAAVCTAGRLVEGAHFVTDVYVGAVLAWVVVWWLARMLRVGAGVRGGPA